MLLLDYLNKDDYEIDVDNYVLRWFQFMHCTSSFERIFRIRICHSSCVRYLSLSTFIIYFFHIDVTAVFP